MENDVDISRLRPLRRALLGWYRRHGRSLPWRAGRGATPDPYHVLVSEAMLQQTQVATVVAYFSRFIQRFPTPASLAAADEQAVLRQWQGLGYYRRARNLHAAARRIVGVHGGAVPSTVQDLLHLPGIGRYTAGAIASIAFGRRAPILDGNVARVLARWFDVADPVDRPATRDRLWSLAQMVADTASPGDVNQAVMDLGAMVCTPRSPQCQACPVARWCEPHRSGRAEQLPRRLPRRPPQAVEHAVFAVESRGRFLFEQRPSRGLWARMWQMPTIESPSTLDPGSLATWLLERSGVRGRLLEPLGEFRHQTTHRTITFTVWQARAVGTGSPAGEWRRLDDVDDLPLARPQQRAVEMARRAQP